MVEHGPRHRLVEAAQLVQQLASPFGMQLDDVELVVVEGARLLEDRVGHRQLSDVVQQPADREATQAGGRETEPLPELDREHCDATRVLLRRRVLSSQADGERANTRAEERLLGGDKLARAQVSDERARAAPSAQVVDE